MKRFQLMLLLGVVWFSLAMSFGTREQANVAPKAAINYSTITEAWGSFSFPTSYSVNTAEATKMYLVQAENITFLASRTNVGQAANTTGNSMSVLSGMSTNPSRYDQFISNLVQVTNGQLINQSVIFTNSYEGREIILDYTDSDNQLIKMFVRFYWLNGNMYTFSVSSPPGDLSAFFAAKQVVFNSITMQQP